MSPQPDIEPMAFGQRMRILRERRHLTRIELAGMLRKSASWVKQVERGEIGTPRLEVILQIAEVLRVRDLADLTGDQHMSIDMFIGPRHRHLPAVRDAINAMVFDGEAPTLDYLRARVDHLWSARHRAPNHREVLGQSLPSLIREAQLAVHQADQLPARRRAQAILAEVYALSQFFLAYQPDSALLWRVAERCTVAAHDSGDPHAIGVSVWLMAQAHRDATHYDAAEQVNRVALEHLDPLLPDSDEQVMAIVGALEFEAGYTAARRGQSAVAWRHWDKARTIADRLPANYYHPITSFSHAIMGAHATTVAVELHAGRESVRQANAAAASVIPSHPRRARHHIEAARAYQLDRQPDAALAALAHAHAAAPETIRWNGYASRIILEETESPSPARRRRAADLAVQVGLLER